MPQTAPVKCGSGSGIPLDGLLRMTGGTQQAPPARSGNGNGNGHGAQRQLKRARVEERNVDGNRGATICAGNRQQGTLVAGNAAVVPLPGANLRPKELHELYPKMTSPTG